MEIYVKQLLFLHAKNNKKNMILITKPIQYLKQILLIAEVDTYEYMVNIWRAPYSKN